MREELIKESLSMARASDLEKAMRKWDAIHRIRLQLFFGPYFQNKGDVIKIRRPQNYA